MDPAAIDIMTRKKLQILKHEIIRLSFSVVILLIASFIITVSENPPRHLSKSAETKSKKIPDSATLKNHYKKSLAMNKK